MPNTPAEIGPGEFYPVVGVGPHPAPWPVGEQYDQELLDRKSTRLNSSHSQQSRMPSSA